MDYAAEDSPEPQGSMVEDGNDSFSSSEISKEGIETGLIVQGGGRGGGRRGGRADGYIVMN